MTQKMLHIHKKAAAIDNNNIADVLDAPKLLRSEAYINGSWVEANKTITITNPADGTVLGTVPNLGATETHQAIEAAEKAFPAWSRCWQKTARPSCAAGRI